MNTWRKISIEIEKNQLYENKHVTAYFVKKSHEATCLIKRSLEFKDLSLTTLKTS